MEKREIINRLSQNNSTLLSYPDRGPWGDNRYRGNCSGWIHAFLIWKYQVEKMAELFAGSGTGSDVAKDMGISYIGADLNPNPVRPNILVLDAIKGDVPDGFRAADLCFMHPPYSELIKIPYCGKEWVDPTGGELAKSDLGQMPWAEFIETLNKILMKYYSAMKGGSKMAVLMGDVRRNGRCYSMFSDIAKPGQLEQVIIKAQHNCVSDGRKYANANFVPIVHEYLMVIKKIEELMLFISLPKEGSCDIRDNAGSTWKDVVLAMMRSFKRCDLSKLYDSVRGHKKAKANPNFEAKVRQTLQQLRDAGFVRPVSDGVWEMAV